MDTATDARKKLLEELESQGVLRDEAVRRAFEKVDRQDFVPRAVEKYAYVNYPLEIGEGQTISQPFTVAFMTQALEPAAGQKILEVGTGSGYQAAILAEIVGEHGLVVTTEIREPLFDFAVRNLKKYKIITILNIDGSRGYAKEAPYDRIIVTAAAAEIPERLLEQLKEGGVMVIPVGDEMHKVRKAKGTIKKTFIGYFAFVPLKE